jgi:radical SAM superfamily enzyme YgiQ (UPF0313 family)
MTSEELGQTPVLRWDDLGDRKVPFLPVQTSRGCRMSCRFCSVPFRRSWRAFPVEHVLASIDAALPHLARPESPSILLADDCLTADRANTLALVRGIAERFPELRVTIEARATDLLDDELLGSLSRLNIQNIQVGIECGYDAGLRRVRKGLVVKQIEALGEKAAALGLGERIRYSYILGFPWETIDEMSQTVKLGFRVARRYGGIVQLNWWLVMPGNELYDAGVSSGLYDAGLYDRFEWFIDRETFFETHPWLDADDVRRVRALTSFLALSNPHIPLIGSAFNQPWREEHQDDTMSHIRAHFSGILGSRSTAMCHSSINR